MDPARTDRGQVVTLQRAGESPLALGHALAKVPAPSERDAEVSPHARRLGPVREMIDVCGGIAQHGQRPLELAFDKQYLADRTCRNRPELLLAEAGTDSARAVEVSERDARATRIVVRAAKPIVNPRKAKNVVIVGIGALGEALRERLGGRKPLEVAARPVSHERDGDELDDRIGLPPLALPIVRKMRERLERLGVVTTRLGVRVQACRHRARARQMASRILPLLCP